MHRRLFLSLSAALPFAATLVRAAGPIDYAPGVAETAMDEGKVILLDFKASWCTTCAAQERVLNALRAENPAYDAAITFINVDWDQFGDGELARSMQIPRRSTLVLMKGRTELARIVAGTGTEEIRALLDQGVAAA
ncbi:MAG: thioredoxin family protein [Gemmobacter sp.]